MSKKLILIIFSVIFFSSSQANDIAKNMAGSVFSFGGIFLEYGVNRFDIACAPYRNDTIKFISAFAHRRAIDMQSWGNYIKNEASDKALFFYSTIALISAYYITKITYNVTKTAVNTFVVTPTAWIYHKFRNNNTRRNESDN